MQVTVLTGGASPERDVAFAGAAQVVRALRSGGHQVRVVDSVTGVLGPQEEARDLVATVGRDPPSTEALRLMAERELGPRLAELEAIRHTDVVFLVLHGRLGEGGSMQALLDLVGVPYTGSGPLGSAIAMDKDVAKRLLRFAGVPTPDWHGWPATPAEIAALGFPLIVKPSKVGSTVGLTLVRDVGAVPAAVQTALQFDDEVLLERYVSGRELTVGILNDRALAVGEIIPRHEIFDYECKYTPGMSREIFPADLPEDVTKRVQALALAAHRTLKLRDFSRIDFRLDDAGVPHCLEANTLPGLTPTSLLPQSAAAMGIGFDALCQSLCDLALRRGRARNKVPGTGKN